MNQKTLLGILAAVVVLGGLIWIARPSQDTATTPAPQEKNRQAVKGTGPLVAEEFEFDFGTISMAAGNVTHTFVAKNTLDVPITIRQVYTSCMCTTATLVTKEAQNLGPYGMPGHGFTPKIEESVAPGEEFSVNAVFDPAAHGPAGIGFVERVITIEYDEGDPLELSFSATVTP